MTRLNQPFFVIDLSFYLLTAHVQTTYRRLSGPHNFLKKKVEERRLLRLVWTAALLQVIISKNGTSIICILWTQAKEQSEEEKKKVWSKAFSWGMSSFESNNLIQWVKKKAQNIYLGSRCEELGIKRKNGLFPFMQCSEAQKLCSVNN